MGYSCFFIHQLQNNNRTAHLPSFRKMTFTEHEFNRDSSVFRRLISQRANSFLRSFALKCDSLLPYQKKIVGKRAAICGDRYGFMKFGCLSVGGMLRTVRLRFGLRPEVCGTKVSIKGNCFGLHVKRIGIASLQSRVLPYTSHLAERPPRQEPCTKVRGLLRPSPTLQNPRHKGHPLFKPARSPRAGALELG